MNMLSGAIIFLNNEVTCCEVGEEAFFEGFSLSLSEDVSGI